jgi:cell division protein FtsL
VSAKEDATSPSSFWLAFVSLWLLCVVSALGVVNSTFESRQLIKELESLRDQTNAFKVEVGQYELEKSALASFSRVESIAVENLNMEMPQSDNTVLVRR